MINLLSVNQKKELKTDRTLAVVNLLGMVTAFVLISFVLAILAAGAFFDGKLRIKAIEAAGVESQLTMMDASQVEKSMSKDNTLCLDVNNFYSRRISAADAALLLANALPQGIVLDQLSINGGSINIGGVSENRPDLVKMQNELEKTSYFKNVNIPPSDWVEQEKLPFNATIVYDYGK